MTDKPIVREFESEKIPGIKIVEVHQQGWEEVYGVLEGTLKKVDKEIREANMKMVEGINLHLEKLKEDSIIETAEESVRKHQTYVRRLMAFRKSIESALNLRLKSQSVRGRAERR